MKRNYWPAALNVAGKACLVVGNDREALEKSERLAKAGANVRRVDLPDFRLDLVDDQFLVIYCPHDDRCATAQVAERCREKRVLLCAIDQPEFCDVVNVSIFERGHLKIATSTNGVSPAAARKIREGLEASLKDVPIEAYFEKLAALREQLEREVKDPAARRKALIAAVDEFRFSARLEWGDGGKK
jgi:siroheme synthase-like protein